jgi:ABC-type uncharacterized transport system permease subunit
MSSRFSLLLTLAFYTMGAVHVLIQALARRKLVSSWTVATTLAGFALQTASLSQRWIEAGHFPAVGFHDGSSFLAWAIVLSFLMTYLRTGLDALALAVYPVSFLLVLLANLAPASGAGAPFQSRFFLPVHTTLAVFGYASLFVAFAMGMLYLIQEHELRSHSPRTFYYLVPSLEKCDTVTVGFGFLTLAIVTGVLWNHTARGRYWSWDAKEGSALIAWVIYVGLLFARYRTGWGGRRAALLGIAGFAAVAFTFVWTLALGGGLRGAH